MIANDVRDEIRKLGIEFAGASPREVLVALGMSPEEVERTIEVVLDRVIAIERAYEGRDHAPLAWLDGLMVGVSLTRRGITL